MLAAQKQAYCFLRYGTNEQDHLSAFPGMCTAQKHVGPVIRLTISYITSLNLSTQMRQAAMGTNLEVAKVTKRGLNLPKSSPTPLPNTYTNPQQCKFIIHAQEQK